MNGLARDDADFPVHSQATVPFVARIRGRHLFVLDMLAVVAISYLAIGLRFERIPELALVVPWWPALAMLLVLRAFSNISFGLSYRSWRYASLPDVLIILTAVAFGSGATFRMFYGITGLLNAAWAQGLPHRSGSSKPACLRWCSGASGSPSERSGIGHRARRVLAPTPTRHSSTVQVALGSSWPGRHVEIRTRASPRSASLTTISA